MPIRKNDTVLIISGKDRGKRGKVLQVLPREGRIVVEGVSIRKKHVRAKKQGEKGQIIQTPGLIDASNAKLLCPKCGKPTKITYRITENKKYRTCKKCAQEID